MGRALRCPVLPGSSGWSNGMTWMFKGESHMVNYKDANEQRQESSIKEWNKNHMVRGEVVAKLRLQASLMTYRQRFKL
jgi:hypothetical protein